MVDHEVEEVVEVEDDDVQVVLVVELELDDHVVELQS